MQRSGTLARMQDTGCMEGSDVGVPFAFQVSVWTTSLTGSPYSQSGGGGGGGGGITGGGNDYLSSVMTPGGGGMIPHHPSSQGGMMGLGSEMDAAVTAKMQVRNLCYYHYDYYY